MKKKHRILAFVYKYECFLRNRFFLNSDKYIKFQNASSKDYKI
jgi:hypothetical protein